MSHNSPYYARRKPHSTFTLKPIRNGYAVLNDRNVQLKTFPNIKAASDWARLNFFSAEQKGYTGSRSAPTEVKSFVS